MDELARTVTCVPWDATGPPGDSDRREIDKRMTAASALLASGKIRDDGDLELVIGFDLGSTSSKIVANFPYAEARGAFAIPAPPALRASDLGPHPYYWHTRLWKGAGGEYGLLPSPDSIEISRIKVNFLETAGDVERVASDAPTPADLHVVAYVALMVHQTLGWVSLRLGKSFAKGGVRVSSNIGFPADPISNHDELGRFQTCFNVGLELALSDRPIDDRAIIETWTGSPPARGMVVPEFVGAVMGYFNSTRSRTGTYFLCDFGGLTCDCVFFRFEQDNLGARVFRIYGAQVATYGAEVAFELLEQGLSQKSFEAAMATFLSSTIKLAYDKIGQHAVVWGGHTPLFRIGGGQHLEAYNGAFPGAEKLIERTHFNTKFDRKALDLAERLDVREARDRSCDRLVLAWGLAHPDLDLPEWVTSAQIPNAQRRAPIQFDYVGPEQI